MSGENWDYKEYQVKELTDEISHEIIKDSLILSIMIKLIGEWLYRIAHELAYHYSGDTEIKNFKVLERAYLKRLKTIIKKMEKET